MEMNCLPFFYRSCTMLLLTSRNPGNLAPRPRRARPRLEALESRTVPTVFTFNTGNPDGLMATASRPSGGGRCGANRDRQRADTRAGWTLRGNDWAPGNGIGLGRPSWIRCLVGCCNTRSRRAAVAACRRRISTVSCVASDRCEIADKAKGGSSGNWWTRRCDR